MIPFRGDFFIVILTHSYSVCFDEKITFRRLRHAKPFSLIPFVVTLAIPKNTLPS